MRVNAKLVERLARLQPRRSGDVATLTSPFLQLHLNPAFGWDIARAFALAGLPFPEQVTGRDQWLFKAYTMFLDPTAHRDTDVADAFQLSQQSIAGTVRAMLIAGLGKPIDEHIETVASKLGIPRRSVEAFETLFFNVLDRHEDGIYLSGIVYPEGRQVEFCEDYFKITPIPDLILRAAYNYRDIDLVAHLAGLDGAACVKELVARHDSESALEAKIMGNALAMAGIGLINQRSVGMQRAFTLPTASRNTPGNLPSEKDNASYDHLSAELNAAINAFPPITEDDRRELLATSRPGRSYCSDDAGNVFPVDDTDESPTPSEPSEPIAHFSEPIPAIWRNKDFDKTVILIARMSEPGMPDHYLTDDQSGIPVSEVHFDN